MHIKIEIFAQKLFLNYCKVYELVRPMACVLRCPPPLAPPAAPLKVTRCWWDLSFESVSHIIIVVLPFTVISFSLVRNAIFFI